MRTVLGYGVLGLFLLIIGLLVFLTLWPRPTDTTEPWVFGNDGAELNYCAPVELDGQGPAADEIEGLHARLRFFANAHACCSIVGANRQASQICEACGSLSRDLSAT